MKGTILVLLVLLGLRSEALAGRPYSPSDGRAQVHDPRFTIRAGAAYPQYSLDATEQATYQIETAAQSAVHYAPATGKVTRTVTARRLCVAGEDGGRP